MWEPNEAIIADLVRGNAERRPDLDVLTFEHLSLDGGATPDEVRTYADLAERGNRLAAALRGSRLAVGDRFALMMRNHPEFVEAMVAASITGTIFVPVDPRTKGEKLAYLLRDSGCRGAICGDYCLRRHRGRAGGASTWRGSWRSRPVRPTWRRSPTPRPWAKRSPRRRRRSTCGCRRPRTRCRSSTRRARPVIPRASCSPTTASAGSRILGRLMGYLPDERPYTGLSLTHGNAQAVTLGPSLSMGLRAVFSRRFTKSRLWDVCRAYGCTTFSLLGGMATAIYSEPRRPDDADNPVRFVASAGMPAAIWSELEQRFGVKVFEWYAAVEGGLACKPIGEGPVGSFGKPLGLEMKILDDDDRECPPYVVGEICSRPAGGEATVSYYGRPEDSAKKTRGGWLRSGDMGHTDADGWLFFDYRKGGGIRHNGDFVNAGFVEKVIAEHPSVSDVFVYGVPAASGAPGEKDVVAAVVPHPGEEVDRGRGVRRLPAQLESNFVPTYLQVVDEIPKTVSEKPIERFLVEKFDPSAPGVVAVAALTRHRAVAAASSIRRSTSAARSPAVSPGDGRDLGRRPRAGTSRASSASAGSSTNASRKSAYRPATATGVAATHARERERRLDRGDRARRRQDHEVALDDGAEHTRSGSRGAPTRRDTAFRPYARAAAWPIVRGRP